MNYPKDNYPPLYDLLTRMTVQKRYEKVEHLLMCGADPNATFPSNYPFDDDQSTIMKMICTSPHFNEEYIQLFLNYGGDTKHIDAETRERMTSTPIKEPGCE